MLRKIRKMLKQQEGFTLVELMIVVVILGILAGIGIQQYGKVQENARITAHNSNIRIIEGAAQMYVMAEQNPLTGEFDSESDTTLESLLEGYLREVPDYPWEGEYSLEIEFDEDLGYTFTVKPEAR